MLKEASMSFQLKFSNLCYLKLSMKVSKFLAVFREKISYKIKLSISSKILFTLDIVSKENNAIALS